MTSPHHAPDHAVEFDAAFDSGRGAWAVRWRGRLLPVRFALKDEAVHHLALMLIAAREKDAAA